MPGLHTPANRPGPIAVVRVTLLSALLVIIVVAVGCVLVSPPVSTRHEILTNPGLYIDLLALLFLAFMLWSSAKMRMSHIAVSWVRYGLLSWIADGTFDVTDEIVVQLCWMGYYCEDLLRLSGMLLIVVRVYKITERINLLYVDARSQSLKDELTQLPNRCLFIDTIREKSGYALGLMILDIDFFEKINNSWGHLVEDEALFSLGKQLAKLTSEQAQPARIGGEEFAIIVNGPSEPELHALAQSILANARTILINHQTPLSINIGVGTWWPDEAQETFIRKVGEALYKVKHSGRDRAEWAPSVGAAGQAYRALRQYRRYSDGERSVQRLKTRQK